jgi:hypothetical protein
MNTNKGETFCETVREGLKNVRTRRQRVVAEEQPDGSYLLMDDRGSIDMAIDKDAALTIIKRSARRRNPGITLTTIEWRQQ